MIYPNEAKHGTLAGFLFESHISTQVTGYNIFLGDPTHMSKLLHPSTHMTGDHLSALKVKTGYMNYKAKISQKSYLENDPNFKCKEYQEHETYSACLENVYSKQIRTYLNCSPPWLDDDTNKWCNESLNIKEDDVESYDFILRNILNYKADIGECFEPCSSLYFDVNLDIFNYREGYDKYGLYLRFEDTVETTKMNIVITSTTLLTRIGGIIGVGKELLWVIVFVCGALKAILWFCSSVCVNCYPQVPE